MKKTIISHINQYLKPQYQVSSANGLSNMFRHYPILPDLCALKGVTESRSHMAFLILAQNSQLLRKHIVPLKPRTVQRSLPLPMYISGALSALGDLMKDVNLVRRYPSLSSLYQHSLTNNDGSAKCFYSFSKSNLVLLLISGCLKPDQKLQKHLLQCAVKKDQGLKKLLLSGYLTSYTCKDFQTTTLELSDNECTYLNVAVREMLCDELGSKSFSGKALKNQLHKDYTGHFTVSSGAVFQLLIYAESIKSLLAFKLQDVLFGDLIQK